MERKHRLLVICPASPRRQWATKLTEKSNRPTMILDAATVRRQRKEGIYNSLEQGKIVIVPCHYASRMEEALHAVPWNLVVRNGPQQLDSTTSASSGQAAILAAAMRSQGLQIHLIALHAAPQVLHKHIIAPPSLAIHADADIVPLEHTGELFTGEPAALAGVEYLPAHHRPRQLPPEHRHNRMS